MLIDIIRFRRKSPLLDDFHRHRLSSIHCLWLHPQPRPFPLCQLYSEWEWTPWNVFTRPYHWQRKYYTWTSTWPHLELCCWNCWEALWPWKLLSVSWDHATPAIHRQPLLLWIGRSNTNASRGWSPVGWAQCEGTCCNGTNSPPWFTVQLPAPTTDVIEVSICADESIDTEDTPIELLEIYVQ
jgi:hypothetical protein